MLTSQVNEAMRALTHLPDKVQRSEMVINTIKDEIDEKMRKNYKAFVKTLKSDEDRLLKNETRIRKCEELFPKVNAV